MEIVQEKNPLETEESPKYTIRFTNKPGRPSRNDIITFSPQPKSIISQYLIKGNEQPISEREPRSHNRNSDELKTTQYLNRSKNLKAKDLVNIKGTSKNYSCSFQDCSYSTTISSNLQKHKRTHNLDKLYLCDQCTFSTKFSNSLGVHKRIHLNNKPYQCLHCDYKCNSSSNLKKHNSHRHPGLP